MKITLINPRDPLTDSPQTILQQSLNMMPLGILYIGTYLKTQGYNVSVVDLNLFQTNDINDYILNSLEEKDNIVGISVSTTCYNSASSISKIIRKNKKDALIVWGGFHPTFSPNEPLNSDLCDIVIRGEGEFILEQIAKLYSSSKLFTKIETIPSISYKNGNSQIIHNDPAVSRIECINKLPFPDRTLLDVNLYKNPSTMIASRGCSGKCNFCASAEWGPPQFREPEYVVDEIDYMVKEFSFDHISFVDNVFAVNERLSLNLLEMINDKYDSLTFSAEVNINYMTKMLIDKFCESGLKYMQFGIESGNDYILNTINKSINIEQVEKTLEYALQKNLQIVTSFIIGHPEDTYQTVMDTIKFAIKLRRWGAKVVFSYLVPYPGSQVFKNREKLGIEIIDWNYEHWAFNELPSIQTKNLDKKTLTDLMQRAIYEVNCI